MPAQSPGRANVRNSGKDRTLSKYCWIGGIVYGLGGVGAAAVSASKLWGSVGAGSLLQSALADGLLWPAALVRWLT